METKRIRLFLEYLKRHRQCICLLCLFSIVFIMVFYLCNLPISEVIYAFALCIFILILFATIDFFKFYKKHRQLLFLKREISFGLENLPTPDNLIEQDYTKLLHQLYSDKNVLLSAADKEKSDMIDYYTLWVHQIKTPIAGMRLLLQSQEKEENLVLEGELFKIEQYVEMVLSYLRIGSDSNDFVFKRYQVEDMTKQAVRKYAKLFIKKKISVELGDLQEEILTDEKWFLFVLEQILSNALKYTNQGSIKIYLQDKQKLVIEDTGIGIEPDDLPRVFEKGYTGYNGRCDKKSTGIGLYLCKRIIKKLGHSISITSKVGEGTKVVIDITSISLHVE